MIHPGNTHMQATGVTHITTTCCIISLQLCIMFSVAISGWKDGNQIKIPGLQIQAYQEEINNTIQQAKGISKGTGSIIAWFIGSKLIFYTRFDRMVAADHRIYTEAYWKSAATIIRTVAVPSGHTVNVQERLDHLLQQAELSWAELNGDEQL